MIDPAAAAGLTALAALALAAGCGGPAGPAGPPAAPPPPDPFAGLSGGVFVTATINGTDLLYRPEVADDPVAGPPGPAGWAGGRAASAYGPLVLEVTVLNRTGRPVRVREPIVPGPPSGPYGPGLRVDHHWHVAQPRRLIGESDRGRLIDGPWWNEWAGDEPVPRTAAEREDADGDKVRRLPIRLLMRPAGAAAADAARAAGEEGWTAVRPGERVARRYRLDRLFDLDRPLASYRFIVRPEVRDADGRPVEPEIIAAPAVANYADADALPAVPPPTVGRKPPLPGGFEAWDYYRHADRRSAAGAAPAER